MDTFLAPVRIASSWRTANVDRYERDACVHVSVIETRRILLLPLSVEVCDYVSSDSDLFRCIALRYIDNLGHRSLF